MATTKQRTTAAPSLVVALTAFVGTTPDGEEHSIRGGEQLRADHIVVTTWPAMFTDAGKSDREVGEAKAAMEANADTPIVPKRQFRAKREVPYGHGKGASSWGSVGPGTILDEDHPVVRQVPEAFQLLRD